MQAMMSWEPRDLIVETIAPEERYGLDKWVSGLHEKAARMRDFVTEEQAIDDTQPPTHFLYNIGDRVLLRRPSRHQKCQTPYEAGWYVKRLVSPTTVVIAATDGNREKVINVELLKLDPSTIAPDEKSDEPAALPEDTAERLVRVHLDASDEDPAPPQASPPYGLRNRSLLRRPEWHPDR